MANRSKSPKPPHGVREIVAIGRDWHIKIQMGCAVHTVLLTAKEFNHMMSDMVENDNISRSILETMAEICRRNFRRGKVARRLQANTIEMIKSGYVSFFGYDWDKICERTRKGAYIETRLQIFGHLNRLAYTDAEIASFFVNRDRTTILSGVNRYTQLYEVDKGFKFISDLLTSHMEKWMLSGGIYAGDLAPELGLSNPSNTDTRPIPVEALATELQAS
jgi:hypothetical protein